MNKEKQREQQNRGSFLAAEILKLALSELLVLVTELTVSKDAVAFISRYAVKGISSTIRSCFSTTAGRRSTGFWKPWIYHNHCNILQYRVAGVC